MDAALTIRQVDGVIDFYVVSTAREPGIHLYSGTRAKCLRYMDANLSTR